MFLVVNFLNIKIPKRKIVKEGIQLGWKNIQIRLNFKESITGSLHPWAPTEYDAIYENTDGIKMNPTVLVYPRGNSLKIEQDHPVPKDKK